MGGTQRKRATVLSHRGDALELRCRQRGVGGDDHKVGARRRVGLEAERQVVVDIGRAEAKPAEFSLLFVGRGPKM